jgi:hypothetical protein
MTYKDSTVRNSLLLTPEGWTRLEAIAADLGSIAPSGSNAGQPSWRTLIKAIADGSLTVTRKESEHDQPSQSL